MPRFILIRPTVWPQYINVTDRTDRQTDGRTEKQRSDSIGRTVLETVAQKLGLATDGGGSDIKFFLKKFNFNMELRFKLAKTSRAATISVL